MLHASVFSVRCPPQFGNATTGGFISVALSVSIASGFFAVMRLKGGRLIFLQVLIERNRNSWDVWDKSLEDATEFQGGSHFSEIG